jgi:hypothetical protein
MNNKKYLEKLIRPTELPVTGRCSRRRPAVAQVCDRKGNPLVPVPDKQLNGKFRTGTFAVAGVGECRFIRLVHIGRNHLGNDRLCICAWEIFGSLIE